MSTPGQMKFGESQITSDSAESQVNQVEEATTPAQEGSHLSHPHDRHEPLHMQDNEATSHVPAVPAEPEEPEEPVDLTKDSSIVLRDGEGTVEVETSGGKFAWFYLEIHRTSQVIYG